MTVYGYARVSTVGQSLDCQIAALKTEGCEKILAEKVTGTNAQRPRLQQLLRSIMPGDLVIVSKLDRLARSTRDLHTLNEIGEAGAKFRSLGEPWADTTTPHGELMVTILGGLATFERHLILARTDEGRKAAQAQGVRFGRKPALSIFQRSEARARLDAGEPADAVARSYGVSRQTVWRLAR
jgi:DNA invertase Pin-like site-specific DNA recombinase